MDDSYIKTAKDKVRNVSKGGLLVASMVGVDMRATMDIDTIVKVLPLNEVDAEKIGAFPGI